MPTCEHCLIAFPSHRAVTATFGGSDKVFCCHACLGVYEMIHTEHLEAFYRKRSKWAPGPVVRLDTDPALFAETVRTIGEDLMEVEVQVGGIRCASCVWLTEKVLEKTHGIREARVNYATHRARIRWVPSTLSLSDILRRIANVGYQPRPLNLTGENQFLEDERRRLLTRLGTALFFSMQLMLYSAALYAGYFYGMPSQFRTLFHLTALVLATPVFFYSGWPFLSGSWRGLKQGSFNMDVLITAGSGSAYLLSIWQLVRGREVYFDTCAMIITLVLLGRYIEFGAKKRSTEAISRLLSLVPGTATRLVAGTDDPSRERSETVPVESVRVGDVLDLRPGNRIPVDGCVTWGTSEVDESMLTGESRPVVKTVGNDVFAGTVNRFGAFRFRVTAVGRNTALSRIVSAVQEAQSRRAPIQKLADRITGYFVPVIVLIALATFTGWWLSGRPAPEALMAAISVMVIACPCALGLATPLAILVGTGRAADSGIILRGGDTVEEMARSAMVVFDKTGTLTIGRPKLVNATGLGMTSEEALRVAGSLEQNSEHPYGEALYQAAEGMDLLPVDDFVALPGQGVSGRVAGLPVMVGTEAYLRSQGVDMKPLEGPDPVLSEDPAHSRVFLAVNGRLAGFFHLSDEVRPEALPMVARLKSMGLDTMMVTGDAETVARIIAQTLAIPDVRAAVSPVGKAEVVRALEGSGKKVLMVGDGINDAPALTEASIGMAVGGANDIALESADAVMLREDLMLVPRVLELTRRTYRVIRQNLFWAFAYNMLAVPLAITGWLHPIMAAGAMALSSLTVVGNSLRLHRH